ncbi:MAG: hypothetical protein ACYDEJ_09250 [Desulfitobacteriaceae bacterium]
MVGIVGSFISSALKGIGISMSQLEAGEAVTKRKSTVQTIVNDADKLKQRSYYLTDKLLKAITIKTAEGDLDKSGVVREALKLYLDDILKKL